MREKVQQCDPAESVIILLKIIRVMPRVCRKRLNMHKSAVLWLCLHKNVPVCVLAAVCGGEGGFFSDFPSRWLP